MNRDSETKAADASPHPYSRLKIEKGYYHDTGTYKPSTPTYPEEEIEYTLTVSTTNIVDGQVTYPNVYNVVNIYDELSPNLANVQVTKVRVGEDSDGVGVDLDEKKISEVCTVYDYALHCGFRTVTFSSATSKIIVTVKAKTVDVNGSDSQTISNTAYVYSDGENDIYYNNNEEEMGCRTLDFVMNGKDTGGGHVNPPGRCFSSLDFTVGTPRLQIAKEVDKTGEVICYYHTKEEPDIELRKDLTDSNNPKAECLNEDSDSRPPSEGEATEAWFSTDIAVREEWKQKAAMTCDDCDIMKIALGLFIKDYISKTLILTKPATQGRIVDNTVSAGDTINFTIIVINTGVVPSKPGIEIRDQLDPIFFDAKNVKITPLSGGVNCALNNLEVVCVSSRGINPAEVDSIYNENGKGEENRNSFKDGLVVRITATVKSDGDIFNRAYVGGGGDTRCPIDLMACYDDAESKVRSVELHINKESKMLSQDCATTTGGEGEEGASAGGGTPCSGTASADRGVTFLKGQEGEYIIRVTNEGEVESKGRVVVHDSIPEQFDVNRVTLTYDYSQGLCELRADHQLYCRMYESSAIAPRGGIWEISVKVKPDEDIKITPDNKHVVNYAYVYGGNDRVCTDESIEPAIKRMVEAGEKDVDNPYDRCYDFLGSDIVSPKLRVTSKINVDQIVAGEPFNYDITVKNEGDYATVGATTMRNTLPKGVKLVDVGSLPEGCEYAEETGAITCTIPDGGIKKGDYISYSFDVVSEAVEGNLTNTALVYNAYDSDCSNVASAKNTARCRSIITKSAVAPMLKIDTYASSLETYAGAQLVYNIRVKNLGNAATSDETIVYDTIPAELKLIGLRASNGTCKPDLSSFECYLPAGIQPGQSEVISVLTSVSNASDEIVNTAYMTGGGDPVCVVENKDEVGNDEMPTKKRCVSSATVRALEFSGLASGGNGAIGAPSSGVLSSLQITGTVVMLGAASYVLLGWHRRAFAAGKI
ncbi:MAG: DUF11 domain-containing protein [Candidatus Nomurabacteria bacterium]|nr:DUF11 domain-containing protein [Candidatus Nomurabacteria bacterium]